MAGSGKLSSSREVLSVCLAVVLCAGVNACSDDAASGVSSGGCGSCADNQTCIENQCVDNARICADSICLSDQICMNGACVDTSRVCGSSVCGEGEVCDAGECKTVCGDGYCRADQTCDAANGVCLDRCGGVTCASGQVCDREQNICVDRCGETTCAAGQVCDAPRGECKDKCGETSCYSWETCVDTDGTMTCVRSVFDVTGPETPVTTEDGGSSSFTVKLDHQPTSEVRVTVETSDPEEGTVSVTELVFTPENWDEPQTVTVTGVSDEEADGDQTYNVTLTATSEDEDFDEKTTSITFTNEDNGVKPGVGVTTVNHDRITNELGKRVQAQVRLETAPTSDVHVSVVSSDEGEGTPDKAELVFTPENWSTPQTVTVTGVADHVADGDQAYEIRFEATSEDARYNGMTIAPLSLTNQDNDSAGVTVSKDALTTDESGRKDTFMFLLRSRPSSSVTVAIESSDKNEAVVDLSEVTIEPDRWNTPVEVTVTGVADHVVDTDKGYSVTLRLSSEDTDYDGKEVSLAGVNLNVDKASLEISSETQEWITDENGRSVALNVTLGSKPSSSVKVKIASDTETEGVPDKDVLEFMPETWNVPQVVTITGVPDYVVDGDKPYKVTYTFESEDSDYANLADVEQSFTNKDTDKIGVTVVNPEDLLTDESGKTASISVKLDTKPSHDVTIRVSSDDETEGKVDQTTLTFTSENWNTPQSVTVTGQADSEKDGDQSYNIVFQAESEDADYDGMTISSVTLKNQDKDTAGLTTDVNNITTNELDKTAAIKLSLRSKPTAPVTITVTSSDDTEASVNPATFEIQPDHWNVMQTIEVTGVADYIVDGNQAYQVTLRATSEDANYNDVSTVVNGTNEDVDKVGVSVTCSDCKTQESGTTALIDIKLNTKPSANVVISAKASDETEGEIETGSLTFTPENWNQPQTLTVKGVPDDEVDGNVTYPVSFSAASSDKDYDGIAIASVNVENQDIDKAGIALDKPQSLMTTESGGSVSFGLKLNSKPAKDVKIALISTNTNEGVLDRSELVFNRTNWQTVQTVKVTGIDDDIQDGDIAYSVVMTVDSEDTNYSALALDSIALVNQDNDTAGISSSVTKVTTSEDGKTESFTVSLSTRPTAQVTVTVTSSDTTEATVKPSQLTFTPSNWNQPQTVTATGVADQEVDGNQAYTVTLNASSSDKNYDGKSATVAGINQDIDVAGYVVSAKGSTSVSESGTSAEYGVALRSKPTSNVTVSIKSGDTGEMTVSPSSLTFTPENWNKAQNVKAVGVKDNIVDGNQLTPILLTSTSSDKNYQGKDDQIIVTVIDIDTAALAVTANTTSPVAENGGKDTVKVHLTSMPQAGKTVTVTVTSDNAGSLMVSPSTLTFDSSNWNKDQTVTVSGVDNVIKDGNRKVTVKMAASSTDTNFDKKSWSGIYTVTDNDQGSVALSIVSVGGCSGVTMCGTATSTTASVKLGMKPAQNVTVTLSTNNATTAKLEKTTLTFTPSNWNTAQTVKITADSANVSAAKTSATITASTDATYGASPATATVTYKTFDVKNYAYSSCSAQQITLYPGTYKFQVWGASGGDGVSLSQTTASHAGLGGYAEGQIKITTKTQAYIYVGSQGTAGTYGKYGASATGKGCNGGGGGTSHSNGSVGYGGGGATDIRLTGNTLYHRVIVAGGGGGADNGGGTLNGADDGSGGYGGGTTGGKGLTEGVASLAAGTQTTGYAFGSGQTYGGDYDIGGGGGGWYGGRCATSGTNSGGGGGSGFVYTGQANPVSGYKLSSSYAMTNAKTVAGNQAFPATSSGNETGHKGNGYARITLLQ